MQADRNSKKVHPVYIALAGCLFLIAVWAFKPVPTPAPPPAETESDSEEVTLEHDAFVTTPKMAVDGFTLAMNREVVASMRDYQFSSPVTLNDGLFWARFYRDGRMISMTGIELTWEGQPLIGRTQIRMDALLTRLGRPSDHASDNYHYIFNDAGVKCHLHLVSHGDRVGQFSLQRAGARWSQIKPIDFERRL